MVERKRLPLLHDNIRHCANSVGAVQFIPDQVSDRLECLTVRVARIAENDWPPTIRRFTNGDIEWNFAEEIYA